MGCLIATRVRRGAPRRGVGRAAAREGDVGAASTTGLASGSTGAVRLTKLTAFVAVLTTVTGAIGSGSPRVGFASFLTGVNGLLLTQIGTVLAVLIGKPAIFAAILIVTAEVNLGI